MRSFFLLLAFTACVHLAPDVAPETSEQSLQPPVAPEVAKATSPPERLEIPPPAPPAATPSTLKLAAQTDEQRERLIDAAHHYLVRRRFKGDCTDFVQRVFSDAKVALPKLVVARSRTEAMYRVLLRVMTPRPGDLAFFHATYDRDGPSRQRNRFTHVAVVESVDGPRLTLIHRGKHGVRRFPMNLLAPSDPTKNGRLRVRRGKDRPGLRYLAGQLFAGFASVFDDGNQPNRRTAENTAAKMYSSSTSN